MDLLELEPFGDHLGNVKMSGAEPARGQCMAQRGHSEESSQLTMRHTSCEGLAVLGVSSGSVEKGCWSPCNRHSPFLPTIPNNTQYLPFPPDHRDPPSVATIAPRLPPFTPPHPTQAHCCPPLFAITQQSPCTESRAEQPDTAPG